MRVWQCIGDHGLQLVRLDMRGADLAHVSEVLAGQGLWDAAAALQGLAGHDGPTLHVVHHQQHLVARGIVHHFLKQRLQTLSAQVKLGCLLFIWLLLAVG